MKNRFDNIVYFSYLGKELNRGEALEHIEESHSVYLTITKENRYIAATDMDFAIVMDGERIYWNGHIIHKFLKSYNELLETAEGLVAALDYNPDMNWGCCACSDKDKYVYYIAPFMYIHDHCHVFAYQTFPNGKAASTIVPSLCSLDGAIRNLKDGKGVWVYGASGRRLITPEDYKKGRFDSIVDSTNVKMI